MRRSGRPHWRQAGPAGGCSDVTGPIGDKLGRQEAASNERASVRRVVGRSDGRLGWSSKHIWSSLARDVGAVVDDRAESLAELGWLIRDPGSDEEGTGDKLGTGLEMGHRVRVSHVRL